MDLTYLLADPGLTHRDVVDFLAPLDGEDLWAPLSRLNRAQQRRLWEVAAKAPPIDLGHFVSPGTASGTEVIHRGRNTLPLPATFRHFEKRFARPDDGSDRLFGYNEGATRGIIGPGFFVARPTAGNADWEARGAVVVDYFLVPDGAVPEGWPAVKPNEQGLQMFVYKGTRDFMRRVDDRVSIGLACKGERSLDHYFVLCRQPAA
jgi:hypothetical protein